MKSNSFFKSIGFSVTLVALLALEVFAAPTLPPSNVTIDVSSFVGNDISLEFSLYDNSGVLYDSWALVDNVALNGSLIDFEDGTLGGFDDSLNPGSVNVVSGNSFGAGSKLMRIDEDAGGTPTVTYKSYVGSGATTLTFDLGMTTSETVGSWGLLDELVVDIRNPNSGAYYIPDALVVNANGASTSTETSIDVIPAPGAGVLAMIGVGCVGLVRRFRKASV